MIALEDAPRLIYVAFGEVGTILSHEPFDGAGVYAFAGNGAPLGPHDSSEHYPPQQLAFVLRSIAENIYCECAPHVLEDMVRIITDAATLIEEGIKASDTVDKASAWDAATATPRSVQRSIGEHRELWIRTILATCTGTDRQRQSFSDGYNRFPIAPRASSQMRANHALGRVVSELLNPAREQ